MLLTKEMLATLVMNFFIAFGVMIGGALIGGIGAFLIGKPILMEIDKIAGSLKIWAIVAAIGGSFDAITRIENGLFSGVHEDIYKTLAMLLVAFCGAQSGTILLRWIIGDPV
ncbi:YtrH family sporulation protein [Shouchella lonarensis]|uniref:Sporulation protein YtrH n=1 Tax=Shouchella lonarensis TaxID=1464122 RepID=A0A1G6GN08_9BACI|nr:YtrH family sporulation protein [Shouchella lonarensis]SDB83430.1 Sporulation protein YtrH [Shouchella lonarensis]